MSRVFAFLELPLGQLPVLKIDNETTLNQSHAISRFLAKEFGAKNANNLKKKEKYNKTFLSHQMLFIYRNLPSKRPLYAVKS